MEYSGSFETYLSTYILWEWECLRESNFLIANFLNYKIYLNKFYANNNNLTIKLIMQYNNIN